MAGSEGSFWASREGPGGSEGARRLKFRGVLRFFWRFDPPENLKIKNFDLKSVACKMAFLVVLVIFRGL